MSSRRRQNPERSLAVFDPGPADVLFDRIQLGLDLLLPGFPHDRASEFVARLGAQRALKNAKRRAGKSVKILWLYHGLDDGGRMEVEGQIDLAKEAAGDLRVTNSSALVINPLRVLRTQLVDPGGPGLDGNDNVVWEHDPAEWPRLLTVQLDDVAAGVGAFVGLLARAAGVSEDAPAGRVWLQHCEVCRDITFADASAALAALGVAGPRDAMWMKERPGREIDGNYYSLSWAGKARASATRKVYVKRPDLLRTEVSMRSRESVVCMSGGGALGAAQFEGGPAIAEGLVEEMKAVAVGAASLLDEIRAEIEHAAAVAPRSAAEFVVGLAPLVRLAAPEPRGPGRAGRPPAEGRDRRAAEVLSILIHRGRYFAGAVAPGERVASSDPILVALKAMCDESAGVLRESDEQPRLFTVRPEFGAARLAMAAPAAAAGQEGEE